MLKSYSLIIYELSVLFVCALSAGVGRTGTFIALDNLYHQAVSEGCLRPLQMVEAIRRQRVNMIQTKVRIVSQWQRAHKMILISFHAMVKAQRGAPGV